MMGVSEKGACGLANLIFYAVRSFDELRRIMAHGPLHLHLRSELSPNRIFTRRFSMSS